ncbi:potassium channel family protein [Paenibacillus thermotolerans]|uniref:potassium channel family protein n=1 Tax=Paenibacillus thermotolerans TaxID=3027807 RepID=UPI002368AFFA|nr:MULTISPECIES: TrkA family potassium uptake protein [unclassified Paenibacillus]
MMRKQYLVIGLGKFGSTVLQELYSLGHNVVGCDRNPALLEPVEKYAQYVVQGDATDDAVLDELNVEMFDAVVVAMATNFEASLFITAKLKKRGCRHVIVKSNDRFRGDILSEIVGADGVVYPEEESGRRTARQLVMPGLMEFVELSPHCSGIEIKAPAAFHHRSLQELDLRKKYGVTVLIINREHLHYPIVSPMPAEKFQPGDSLFIVGKPDDLGKFQSQYF